MPLDWSWSSFDALSGHELYALLALRQAVFVVEQRCAYLDADGRDRSAMHLLGWRDGSLEACLRVFPPDAAGDVWIGRVVTSSRVRGTGLGRALMSEGLRRAREAFGPRGVHISAQAHLEGFYGSLGFQVSGPGYLEDDIPHLPMHRRL